MCPVHAQPAEAFGHLPAQARAEAHEEFEAAVGRAGGGRGAADAVGGRGRAREDAPAAVRAHRPADRLRHLHHGAALPRGPDGRGAGDATRGGVQLGQDRRALRRGRGHGRRLRAPGQTRVPRRHTARHDRRPGGRSRRLDTGQWRLGELALVGKIKLVAFIVRNDHIILLFQSALALRYRPIPKQIDWQASSLILLIVIFTALLALIVWLVKLFLL